MAKIKNLDEEFGKGRGFPIRMDELEEAGNNYEIGDCIKVKDKDKGSKYPYCVGKVIHKARKFLTAESMVIPCISFTVPYLDIVLYQGSERIQKIDEQEAIDFVKEMKSGYLSSLFNE